MGGRLGRKPETLEDLLADEGIQLNGERIRLDGRNIGGPRSKLLCPSCGGGQSQEKSFYILFDKEGDGFRSFCHRASCSQNTINRSLTGSNKARTVWTPKVYRRPEPPEDLFQPPTLFAYFAKFGISADTVRALGIYRTVRGMPRLNAQGKQDGYENRPVIAYPYRDGGELLNTKFKTIYADGAKRFTQEKDAEPSLFNIDKFRDEEAGYFVEGEDDVLAMYEAGYWQTTTLVDGSPAKIRPDYNIETDDDDRYLAIRGNSDPRIARLKRIVLAGDMDQPGRNHHEEIARRLGKARCWVVNWPEGCKDAKETLAKLGQQAVRAAVATAKPYPLEGLKQVSREEVSAFYNGIARYIYRTGIPAIDARVQLSDEGGLVIMTGIPNHGKSAFLSSLAVLLTEHQAEEVARNPIRRQFHTTIFTSETKASRIAVDLVSQRRQQPFFPHKIVPRMQLAEAIETHEQWVERHFAFLEPPEGGMPTLTWVLQRIEEQHTRHGSQFAIIDPWQDVDDELPSDWKKAHTYWITRRLDEIRRFARRLRMTVALVVHPKMLARQKDGTYPVPTGYDLNGSQAFFSKCDCGLTVHRHDFEKYESELVCWKSKDTTLFRYGETRLRFDPTTTRYWPALQDVDSLQGDTIAQGRWK